LTENKQHRSDANGGERHKGHILVVTPDTNGMPMGSKGRMPSVRNAIRVPPSRKKAHGFRGVLAT